MFFERIYDRDLAQASYLIGCQASGEAIVIDPHRDVEAYLASAAREGLRIVHVSETHVHADYLSGARELAERSGATLHLSAEGGDAWSYRFPHSPLRDGDEIRIGPILLRALHTPGHTPEHLSFLVIDGAASPEPLALITGDFMFAGDVGRPDLLDEAAGFRGTRVGAAQDLYASLRDRFLTLPDHVLVWPGHGAGSACGKALGAMPVTTVGFERRSAWWAEALAAGQRDAFVQELLQDQPDAPAYFGRMKRVNLAGPPLLGKRSEPAQLDPATVAERLAAGELLLLDTRSKAEWHADSLQGALFVPAGDNFATYASYAIDPDRDGQDVVVVARDAGQAAELRDKLARIGIDRFAGYLNDLTPFPRATIRLVPATEASDADALLLDTREATAHRDGHLPGARQLHTGQLRWRLADVPHDRTVVAYCQTGGRSAVAASVLRLHGHPDVREIGGGFDAWQQAQRDGGTAIAR